MVREIMLPAASPMIFTGLRLSLQASWTTLVAAELVGSFAGLGHVLNVAQRDIRPDAVLYAMVWVGLCGAVMSWLLGQIERWRVEDGAAFDAGPGGSDYWLGRLEVRFADFHVNDVPTLGFECPGARHQLHDVKWGNVGKATGRKGRHGSVITVVAKQTV